MSTTNSAISFQGLSSGVQTDALINAILAQKGTGLVRLQAQQARNAARTTALTTMQSQMSDLYISLSAIQDKLNARTVTSSDVNNTYVSATATGAAAGSYDLTVTTIATKGRISATAGNLSVADPTASITTGAMPSFAVKGTDGVIKAFTLNNNSLNGLRDAINASGAGVTATVVNTGAGTNPYQLVVTANATGTGSTGGIVTLADVTAGGAINTLGISAGTVDSMTTPTTLTGGLTSGASGQTAVDAVFTVNGIQLTRKTNVVTDAATGVTFTLKQGGQTGLTTLTVAQDKAAATAGMQDVISKFNTIIKSYSSASAVTKNADGSPNKGPLADDYASQAMITKIRSTLTGLSAGLPSTATFHSLADLGVATQRDGTLTLDTNAFQAALDKDPGAVKSLFNFSASTTNGVVAFQSAGSKTATGPVTFNVTYAAGGAVSGTFSGTYNGVAFTNLALSGTNGTLTGAVGTALEGLNLSVTGSGSGTLTLSRGAGLAASDLITSLTSSGSGSIASTLQIVQTQNRDLAVQIDQAQSALARQKLVLQQQFSNMEVIVGQLKAGASSLSGL
jgi:flagellar hook-associated protein 2